MTDWDTYHPLQIWYRYQGIGGIMLMSGKVDVNSQPFLPAKGARMEFHGNAYRVIEHVWRLDGDEDPWQRPTITVELELIEE